LVFFQLYAFSAGFAGNTLLLTDQGQIVFDKLNSTMFVQSDVNQLQPVLFLGKQSVETVIQISIADEIITCHPKQLFWCVNKNDWIPADNLNIGDLLQAVDEQYIAIDIVQLVQQQTKIYSLTVGPPHYLYVGKYAVRAHNVMPIFIGVIAPLATSVSVVKVASAVACTGLVALGGCIANFFAKNNNKKKPKLSVAAQPVGTSPVFFNPNDDDKNKHPNGIYEDADYHGLTQNGRKSPRPKDGQKALDNSYAFGEELSGRIAIQDGEFVVLRSHNPGKYHGYRCQWEKLPDEARAILQKFNLASKRGKIF
jgi:hypothetical protein